MRILLERSFSALTKNPENEPWFGGNVKQLQSVLQPAALPEAAAAFWPAGDEYLIAQHRRSRSSISLLRIIVMDGAVVCPAGGSRCSGPEFCQVAEPGSAPAVNKKPARINRSPSFVL